MPKTTIFIRADIKTKALDPVTRETTKDDKGVYGKSSDDVIFIMQ